MQHTDKTSQRNFGIDLLRLLAAAYVLILHTILQGGIFHAATPYSYQHITCQFLLSVSYCAVTLFGIISGYVGYSDTEKPIRFSGYAHLWLEVVFYGAGITLLAMVFIPEAASVRQLYSSLLPVSSNLYWYFTAYTLLFFFIPLLNTAVRHSGKHILLPFFWGILLLFPAFETATGYFLTNGGYSFLWLMILYLVGAIMKKYRIGHQLHLLIPLGCVLLFTMLTFGLYIFIPKLAASGLDLDLAILESYTFPLYLLSAVSYVIFFARLNFVSWIQKLIAFASPAAFAIYLCNVHPVIWLLQNNRFHLWSNGSVPGLCARIFAYCLLFAVTVMVIDWLRRQLFRLLHIKEVLLNLESKVFNP